MSDENSEKIDRRGIMTVVLIFGGLFAMLLIFSFVLISAFGEDSSLAVGGGGKIGVIEVIGPISESKKIVKDIRRFEKKKNIKAILVRINSPGGAVAPSQEMYEAVMRAGEKKPVAASMGSTAASGGYYIAIGADKIYANGGSITGSIGVISQLFNVQGLLQKVDVKVNTVKTGKYKDAGSPFRDFDPEDRQYFQDLISDIYEQFVEDVAERRKLDLAKVRELADGSVYTGRQAKDLELVDEIGTFHDTVQYLKDEAGIEGEPDLVYPPKEDMGFLSQLVENATNSAVNSAVDSAKTSQTPVIEYRMVSP
ncbi:MAG: signal peptide peptidase SppA [Myxococcota bacterium]